MERALAYMGLTPGMPLTDIAIDRVFIGSCTNSRIEDLRVAAQVVGRTPRRDPGAWWCRARAWSRRRPKPKGWTAIFKRAGFEWREAGCSMCVGMNGDLVAPGERCASTSNRNFVGRQGRARARICEPGDGGRRGRDRPADRRAQLHEAVMEPFQRLDAVAAPIGVPNVDTDQIIPARFLLAQTPRMAGGISCSTTCASTTAHEAGLRAQPAGLPRRPHPGGGPQLRLRIVARARRSGRSTTTASAPCIAPSFGDIFFNNSFQNGLLPVVLPAERIAALRTLLLQKPGAHIGVDLQAQTVTGPDGQRRSVRDRSVPQGVPAGRHRRHRVHAAPRRRDRGVRAGVRRDRSVDADRSDADIGTSASFPDMLRENRSTWTTASAQASALPPVVAPRPLGELALMRSSRWRTGARLSKEWCAPG